MKLRAILVVLLYCVTSWMGSAATAAAGYEAALARSNTAAIGSNIVFFLTSREKRLLPARTFDVNEKLDLALFLYPFEEDGTNSPALKFLMHPGLKPFELSLTEKQSGNKVAVKKEFMPAKADVPRSMADYERMKLVSVNHYSIKTRSLPSASEAFDIRSNGVYTLEVRVTVCVPLTNSVPDYRAMAAKGSPREPFGLIRSDPITVTINK